MDIVPPIDQGVLEPQPKKVKNKRINKRILGKNRFTT